MHRLASVACVLLGLAAAPAEAQERPHRLGIHYSVADHEQPEGSRNGPGVFVVYAPTRWIGLDVGSTFFFHESMGGHAWQLLAGPRVGTQFEQWPWLGIFGRVRPGLIRFTNRFIAPETACILVFPPPDACLADRLNFALDIGASVELYAREALLLRFDAGDTLFRFGRDWRGPTWTHGFQVTAGAGWRF